MNNKANGINPTYFAMMFGTEIIYPDAVSSSTATVKAGVRSVRVGTVVVPD